MLHIFNWVDLAIIDIENVRDRYAALPKIAMHERERAAPGDLGRPIAAVSMETSRPLRPEKGVT
jgi:hypothetical protein